MWKQVRLWFCRYLGWHSPRIVGFDGCSFVGMCRKCGYRGLIDSQGNLF